MCHDVQVEPRLQTLTGETFDETTANITDEARADSCGRGFWITGQMAFYDVRVFNHPNTNIYVKQELSHAYILNEKEKKRKYNERIMQVEHGTFTPLIMSATGGPGRESHKFYSRLAEMITEKRKQRNSIIISWIRRKICFSLINSVCMCKRGSRSVFQTSHLNHSLRDDAKMSEATSRIY